MTTHEETTLPIGQLAPIRHDNLLINFTTEFLRIWDTLGSRAKPAAFWRPTPAADMLPGYFPLGDVVNDDYDDITGRNVVAVVCEAEGPSADPAKGKALRRPDDYELIWKDSGSRSKKDGAIWRPIAPEGYVALGSVCSNGHEKPSFNAVRCVRADLVIASGLSVPVWSDKGSGARQSVSTWSAVPPSAQSDEINLAPGTFVGIKSYSTPSDFLVYSLRIQIPLEGKSRPSAPVLNGVTPPFEQMCERITQTARLPWFVVKDPSLSPREQPRNSPFYSLQRTDYYQLVGHCHNSNADKKTFRWTAPRAQTPERLRSFSALTSVEFGAQWQSNVARPFLFSARLNSDFTQSDVHSNEWLNTAPIEIAAVTAAESWMAVYLMQSEFALLRADGSPVTNSVSFTDANTLHFSEYTAPTPSVATLHTEETAPAQSPIDITAANSAQVQTEPPTATDTAP